MLRKLPKLAIYIVLFICPVALTAFLELLDSLGNFAQPKRIRALSSRELTPRGAYRTKCYKCDGDFLVTDKANRDRIVKRFSKECIRIEEVPADQSIEEVADLISQGK